MTSTGTIRAIETEYAGCRFRSRLEARWAVFMDHLGIRWLYEDQGYNFAGLRYLPDFYLPEIEVFCEVKGGDSALAASMETLRAFSRAQPEKQVVVLGEVSDVTHEDPRVPAHTALLKGEDGIAIVVGRQSHQFLWIPSRFPATTERWRLVGLYSDTSAVEAYSAARRARFEHGESG